MCASWHPSFNSGVRWSIDQSAIGNAVCIAQVPKSAERGHQLWLSLERRRFDPCPY